MARKSTSKSGKPSFYTQDIADEFCRRVASGRSKRDVTRDPDMPHDSAVIEWLNRDEAFAVQYARACQDRADVIFDEMFEIADTPMIGEKIKTDHEGKTETTTGDMIEHRRLQIDARKWALARMNPRKFGDKLDLSGRIGLTVVLDSDADKL